jgi:hypothetical protein
MAWFVCVGSAMQKEIVTTGQKLSLIHLRMLKASRILIFKNINIFWHEICIEN